MSQVNGADSKRYPWVPDFFIVGAMKCGTTTLHHALAAHESIFIPEKEVFFFDVDDFLQHPNFFPYEGQRWFDQDFEVDKQRNLEWYKRFFTDAQPGQLIGEDSTTYLASVKAPERIADFNPQARIIVMLRDPVERAYSAYWHLMRYARVSLSFEDMLRLQPEPLLERSFYLAQIKRYVERFGRARVHVELLEEYRQDTRAALTRTLQFLGLDPHINDAMLAQHSNRGSAPRFPAIARLRNRLLWRSYARDVYAHIADAPVPVIPAYRRRLFRAFHGLYRRLNPLQSQTPPMRPETREFLNGLLERENRGLEALLDKDVAKYWYKSAA